MLKISTEDSGNHVVTLRLEGRVAGPWTSELRSICEKLLNESRTVQLKMAEVLYLDPSGVKLLTELMKRGVLLNDCSPFTAEQLKNACARKISQDA
jgi:hypothetical protein